MASNLSVSSQSVMDGVSITLVNDGRGWRFQSWAHGLFQAGPLPPEPSEEDRARLFQDIEAAVAYFKSLVDDRAA